MAIEYARPSILDVSLYCAAAAERSTLGAGRSAFMGQVFHKCCSAESKESKKERDDMFLQLTEEERDEVCSWNRPQSIEYGDTTLHYKDAEKELPVELHVGGTLLTKGTLDMAWVVVLEGVRTAFIGDIKKSIWTVEGPDTLQLHAYALGYAEKHNCSQYACGIWAAKEAKWQWSQIYDIVWDTQEIAEKVFIAARNTNGQAVTGPHCRNCYGRFNCQEHCLHSASELAPLKADEITEEKVAELLLAAQAVEDQVEKAKAFCKEYARRTGGIRRNGKVYKYTTQKGKDRVVSVKKLRELMGEEAEHYIQKGSPVSQCRWVNE
jgi:hypothetical protein